MKPALARAAVPAGRSTRRSKMSTSRVFRTAASSTRETQWERMIRAVEKVRERLHRSAAALDAAAVPYAIVGGNAVAAKRPRRVLSNPDVLRLTVARSQYNQGAILDKTTPPIN